MTAQQTGPVRPGTGTTRPGIDTTRPHPARMYDYFLGGKNNFAEDRAAAEQALKGWGTARTGARENRAFLGRTVRYLVAEAGIRQFLDIGTGLPSTKNVHEVAQDVAPSCRVVYVDNDPIVMAHARALLTSSPEGKTAYIHADLREPDEILGDPAAQATLDFSQPVALMLVAILHFVPDSDGAQPAVRTLIDALPSGSYVVASHATDEHAPATLAAAGRAYGQGGVAGQLRTADEFGRLVFSGLRMVDPGLVLVSEWRPDGTGLRPLASEVNTYGGVARKP
jgi:S-adenosyl methyltransferase